MLDDDIAIIYPANHQSSPGRLMQERGRQEVHFARLELRGIHSQVDLDAAAVGITLTKYSEHVRQVEALLVLDQVGA